MRTAINLQQMRRPCKEATPDMHACAVPGAAQPAVLDFGQVVDAIMVGEMGRLSLNNLTLVNAAPRHVPHTDTHARYRIDTFGPYPSITVLPNATVRVIAAYLVLPGATLGVL